MSQPRIHTGMIVRSRDGEPVGRVISVEDDGFVLERRVVVTREHRMRFDEIHAVDEHGIVLDPEHAWPRHGLEATDLVEVFWSARRARDDQRPLEAQGETIAAPQQVAATEHAEAYPIQVERGTVRSPRYVPMSQEPTRHAGSAGEPYADRDAEDPPEASRSASPEDPPKRRPLVPWSQAVRLPRAAIVRHYAIHPLQAAASLLDRLRGERPGVRH